MVRYEISLQMQMMVICIFSHRDYIVNSLSIGTVSYTHLDVYKRQITARDSLAAHIFLLDNDKNVLIESAENDATISDRSWIEKISGNTGAVSYTHLDVYKRQV